MKNTSFEQGALFLNGTYEHGGMPGGFKAVAMTHGLDCEAFTVSLDFWPVDFKSDHGSNHRLKEWWSRIPRRMFQDRGEISHDPILMAGSSYRWLGVRQINGDNPELTLNNQSFSFTRSRRLLSPPGAGIIRSAPSI